MPHILKKSPKTKAMYVKMLIDSPRTRKQLETSRAITSKVTREKYEYLDALAKDQADMLCLDALAKHQADMLSATKYQQKHGAARLRR